MSDAQVDPSPAAGLLTTPSETPAAAPAATPATTPAQPAATQPPAEASAPLSTGGTPATTAAAAAPAGTPPVGKPTDEKAAAEALAKSIEAMALKLPEGFDPKDPGVAEFKKLAATAGLDLPKAQGLYDLHTKALQTAMAGAEKTLVERFAAEQTKNREAWRSSLRADKDFGGAQFDKNVAAARQVFAKYGANDGELTALLNDTGFADHPALVKLFARIGKDLGEDSLPAARPAAPRPSLTSSEGLKALYPNSPDLFATH